MTPRDQDTPPTHPGIRESQLTIDRGPVYQGLARELSERLYRLRLDGASQSIRIAAGGLAQDVDSVAGLFATWGALSDNGKRHIIREWQDVKARARKLGVEIL